jgi:histidyl-tRNA synthetase
VLHDAAQGDIPWDADRISSLMSGEHSVAEHLASWARDVEAVIGEGRVMFDPTLVRGMGYYTGSIVELEHPELGVSMGGGGRYDGMVGRFLGKDMPAFGFSLGFERLIDLLDVSAGDEPARVALLYSGEINPATVVRLKKELVAQGMSVRLVSVSRNMKAVFERLETEGFKKIADVTADISSASDLEWRALATR